MNYLERIEIELTMKYVYLHLISDQQEEAIKAFNKLIESLQLKPFNKERDDKLN